MLINKKLKYAYSNKDSDLVRILSENQIWIIHMVLKKMTTKLKQYQDVEHLDKQETIELIGSLDELDLETLEFNLSNPITERYENKTIRDFVYIKKTELKTKYGLTEQEIEEQERLGRLVLQEEVVYKHSGTGRIVRYIPYTYEFVNKYMNERSTFLDDIEQDTISRVGVKIELPILILPGVSEVTLNNALRKGVEDTLQEMINNETDLKELDEYSKLRDFDSYDIIQKYREITVNKVKEVLKEQGITVTSESIETSAVELMRYYIPVYIMCNNTEFKTGNTSINTTIKPIYAILYMYGKEIENVIGVTKYNGQVYVLNYKIK